MSAYGDIVRASSSAHLPASIWVAARSAPESSQHLTVHHLTKTSARAYPGLVEYLAMIFAKEVESGRTYPQEDVSSQTTFESYFFSADVFVGIIGTSAIPPTNALAVDDGLDASKAERTWDECVGGFYYIKPNYPGRSSHVSTLAGIVRLICNAGFLVPPPKRGQGFGISLAKSFVHYAPQLGYQASVFNLVYVNNAASVRLWEMLGFTRAGIIPRAGRLRTKDGKGEEYVDAFVIYKSFVDLE